MLCASDVRYSREVWKHIGEAREKSWRGSECLWMVSTYLLLLVLSFPSSFIPLPIFSNDNINIYTEGTSEEERSYQLDIDFRWQKPKYLSLYFFSVFYNSFLLFVFIFYHHQKPFWILLFYHNHNHNHARGQTWEWSFFRRHMQLVSSSSM